jgi:hypothetical protein
VGVRHPGIARAISDISLDPRSSGVVILLVHRLAPLFW